MTQQTDSVKIPVAENQVGPHHRVMYFLSATVVFVLSLMAISIPNPLGVAPYPLISFVMSQFLGPVISAAVPALAFLVWCKPLFEEGPIVPKRSRFALLGLSFLSLRYFISNWDYGLMYQGQKYVETMGWVNAGIVATLLVISLLTQLKRSLALTMAFHLIMFSWIGFCFLPYFGEML